MRKSFFKKLAAMMVATVVAVGLLPNSPVSANTVSESGLDVTKAADAQAITVGETYDVTIANKTGMWFKFTPDKTAAYEIYSSDESNDPNAYLFADGLDASASYITNDDGKAPRNFSFSQVFEAGKTYYIYAYSISGTAGSYTLHVTELDYYAQASGYNLTPSPNEEITMDSQVWVKEGVNVTYAWYDRTDAKTILSTQATCNMKATHNATYECKVTVGDYTPFTVSVDVMIASGLRSKSKLSQNICVKSGEGTTLKTQAKVDSGNLTYEWYKGNEVIADQKSTTYTLTNLTEKASYYCMVSDDYGNVITYAYYIEIENNLSVKSKDGITEYYICTDDSSRTMEVVVTCDDDEGLTYTWKDKNLNVIEGANTSSYTVNSSGSYTCVVKDKYGNTDSIWFLVSYFEGDFQVEVPTTISGSPAEIAKTQIKATPVSALENQTYTYKWSYIDPMTKENIDLANTTDALSLVVLKVSTRVRCTVTNQNNTEVTQTIEVDIENGLCLKGTSVNYAYDENENFEGITMSIDATADSGDLSYMWFEMNMNEEEEEETLLEGKTSSSLTVNDTKPAYYQGVVFDKYINVVYAGFVLNDCDHHWVDPIVTKQATTNSYGLITYQCEECDATKTVKVAKVAKAAMTSATVTLSKTKYTYDGKAKKPTVTVKSGSTTLKNGKDYKISYKNNVNVGKASVVVTGKGNYSGTITKTFTIEKAKPNLKLKAKKVTFKAKKLKKKKATAKIKVTSNSNGKITYKVLSGNKELREKVSVNKNGKVTVKKGAKKGKVVIKVSIAATKNYKADSVRFTVDVK
ncbi:MAG: MBG domain-containing protein [Eubacterium sp.]|nr:MBG domain-containing protein [Eubacterium sp.]